MDEFEGGPWEKIKEKDYTVLTTGELRRQILPKIGYKIDGEGYLIDKRTGKKVCTEDGSEINLNKDKEVALIAGSHIFVKNVAGYAHLLTERGLVKVRKVKTEE